MYIVQEIQTVEGQISLLPAIIKVDKNEAESAYHSILASAAISNVEVHSVIMYDEHGNIIINQFYEHISGEV